MLGGLLALAPAKWWEDDDDRPTCTRVARRRSCRSCSREDEMDVLTGLGVFFGGLGVFFAGCGVLWAITLWRDHSLKR
jgi:hypothetical protein